uniref:Uncharacterized protein n=1 Tax=Vaucheria litorea TaxID=109269 RepID=H6WB98_VAULI|nr:hypothetical protein [Vaucheria litorea]
MIGIGFFLLTAINTYIMVLWQHPDDKNESYWAKFLVVMGLTLAEGTLLFLPLDVANNGGNVQCNQFWSSTFCGSIDMHLAWTVLFYLILIFTFFLIPFTIFFYEEDDTLELEGQYNFKKTLIISSKYMLALVIMVSLILALTYLFLGKSELPVDEYRLSVGQLLSPELTFTINDPSGRSRPLVGDQITKSLATKSQDTIRLNVSFGLFLLAILAFIGWFLFAAFAGLGIPGISIDLIREFLNRPKRLDRGQISALEMAVQRRCKELVEIGTMLKQKRAQSSQIRSNYLSKQIKSRADNKEFNRFKQMVYVLEEDFDQFVLCKAYSTKYNPLKPIFWLCVGIVSAIIGLLWILHMILYMLIDPPATNFLNEYFNWFDQWFPLFGTVSVAIFSAYLLAAAIKGCFKFGLRIVWFTLHPMKINETYMNSFLFNVGIILLCVPAAIQFCVQAFSSYAVSAEINNILNVQVRYLRFFQFFYANNVFVYALLILTVLSSIYLAVRPSDSSNKAKIVRETLIRLGSEQMSVR